VQYIRKWENISKVIPLYTLELYVVLCPVFVRYKTSEKLLYNISVSYSLCYKPAVVCQSNYE
jgi:hypothetical protein